MQPTEWMRMSVLLLVLLLALAPPLAGCPARRLTVDARPAAPPPGRTRPRPAAHPSNVPESGPLGQKILYEQAKALLRGGQPERALPLFRRSIAAHSRGELLPSCYLGLGSALADLGRHREAVDAYRKVTELRPSDPDAFRVLAAGLEEAGQLAEARRNLEHSLSLDPDQPSAYQDLASLHLRDKNVEAAKQVYLRYELTRTRLILALGRSPDEQRRVAAAAALGEARDEATVKALGLALTDRSRRVRAAVIRALGQQGLAGGAGPLRELEGRSHDAEERRLIEASLKAISGAPQPPPAGAPPAAPRGQGTGAARPGASAAPPAGAPPAALRSQGTGAARPAASAAPPAPPRRAGGP
jgi:Flp pilus assembly protein TadD